MELAISFKSNALLAKAIEVQFHPATGSRDSAANQDIVSDYHFLSLETSPEHMDKEGTNQPLLGADSRMERDYHEIKVDACKPLVPKRKRKRSNLNTKSALKRKGNTLSTRSASSYVVRSVITRCSGHAEGLLTTTENADHVHQLRADGVAQQAHENFLSQENAGCGDSLGFNQDVDVSNKYVHDKASVCDADRDAIKPVNLYFKVGSDTEDEASEHPNLGETMQMEKDAIISGVEFKDANSEDILLSHADTAQVMLDANPFRSLEGAAVTKCSNVASEETSPEFEASHFDYVGTDLSHNIYSVEGSPKMIIDGEAGLSIDNSSPEVISDKETCVSVGHSSKVIIKRKREGSQVGLSGTKTNVNVETVRIIDDGLQSVCQRVLLLLWMVTLLVRKMDARMFYAYQRKLMVYKKAPLELKFQT